MGKIDSLYNKSYYCSIIMLAFTLICFFILTLSYCLLNDLKVEENNPNKNLTGIYSFSFYNSSPSNPEYYESIPNLGYTGKPIYDCYRGECHYYREYECEKEVCTTDAYGDNECETITTICKSYPSSFQYKSSTQCKDNNGKFCDSCYEMEGYTYQKCSCSHVDSDYYSSSFYCKADNLIFNWKNYYYKKSVVQFNYLDNAVPSNKACPDNTRLCGILDEHRNKLCIEKKYPCPINYVT